MKCILMIVLAAVILTVVSCGEDKATLEKRRQLSSELQVVEAELHDLKAELYGAFSDSEEGQARRELDSGAKEYMKRKGEEAYLKTKWYREEQLEAKIRDLKTQLEDLK